LNFNPYYVVEYEDELLELEQTYRRALSHDVSAMAAWLRSRQHQPLLAVGAGGSLPVAELIARLHYLATGHIAKSSEPIELFNLNPRADGFAGVLVTAGGGHSDSLAACARLAHDVGGDWAVFCGKEDSPGEALLQGSDRPVFAFELLPDAHGWVAVNALLGQAVVAAQAFAVAYPEHFEPLPASLADLLPLDATTIADLLERLTASLGGALSRDRLVFLYGPDTRAAALDLDSKFAESGLGWLSLSEYRNFAHGRYQALLPQPERYGVLAFVTPYEEAIARATLACIPDPIAVGEVTLPVLSGAAEQVSSLVTLLVSVGALAKVRKLRPGWGTRGTFGDELYEFDLSQYFPLRTAAEPLGRLLTTSTREGRE
jgi:fructoselysine-6-P-deglycase FrlB-like protein